MFCFSKPGPCERDHNAPQVWASSVITFYIARGVPEEFEYTMRKFVFSRQISSNPLSPAWIEDGMYNSLTLLKKHRKKSSKCFEGFFRGLLHYCNGDHKFIGSKVGKPSPNGMRPYIYQKCKFYPTLPSMFLPMDPSQLVADERATTVGDERAFRQLHAPTVRSSTPKR